MKTLSLDLSTTCTGWALFEGENLASSGRLKSSKAGLSKYVYPYKQIMVINNMVTDIIQLILDLNPDKLVIEEVNLHKNRVSGKTLDGLHMILASKLLEIEYPQEEIYFIDSDGQNGWRYILDLKLTPSDKEYNKEARKLNNNIKLGERKVAVLTKKHLACRLINHVFKKSFDVDANKTDADEVDAIGLGYAFTKFPNFYL